MRISDWSSDVCSSDLRYFLSMRSFTGYSKTTVYGYETGSSGHLGMGYTARIVFQAAMRQFFGLPKVMITRLISTLFASPQNTLIKSILKVLIKASYPGIR